VGSIAIKKSLIFGVIVIILIGEIVCATNLQRTNLTTINISTNLTTNVSDNTFGTNISNLTTITNVSINRTTGIQSKALIINLDSNRTFVHPPASPPFPYELTSPKSNSFSKFSLSYGSSNLWDEQIAELFTQNSTDLAFNVTATAQAGTDGHGPAYFLNGLSNNGYWYQVGLSYNWYPDSTPGSGFYMTYQVWHEKTSIFPGIFSGFYPGVGLLSFSNSVNPGDKVLIRLYLNTSNNTVTMYAHDWNTNSSAIKPYTAEAATEFIGNTSHVGSSNGTFTGLMTEQYHTGQYNGTEQPVNYTIVTQFDSSIPPSFLFIDEYNYSGPGEWGKYYNFSHAMHFNSSSPLKYFTY
jgi:hypothetical protein